MVSILSTLRKPDKLHIKILCEIYKQPFLNCKAIVPGNYDILRMSKTETFLVGLRAFEAHLWILSLIFLYGTISPLQVTDATGEKYWLIKVPMTVIKFRYE